MQTNVARLKEVLAAFGRRRSLRDPIAAAAEELELTPAQIHTLLWLKIDGPLTMGEIARRVSSEKTVTGIVDRLEKRKLVHRDRGERDRRVIRCRLTKTGRRRFIDYLAVLEQLVRDAAKAAAAEDSPPGKLRIQPA